MYEMLNARTPFRGETQDETFNRILHQKLQIPPTNSYGPVSKNCRDLIKRLLNVDSNKRLGHKHGALDIKSHPFFKGMKWDALQSQPPALNRGTMDMLDFSNFQQDLVDSEDDEEESPNYALDPKKMEEINYKSKLFRSFVFTPKTPTTEGKAVFQ
jgi:serine/threonine protein kinase